MTKHLTIMPTIVGVLFILFGYHFDVLELKFIGGLYLGYGTIIHIRNVNLVRVIYSKQRTII